MTRFAWIPLSLVLFMVGCASVSTPPVTPREEPAEKATPEPGPSLPAQPFVSTNVPSGKSPADFRETIRENLRITQREPRNYGAYMRLGEAYHHLKQLTQAERAYENASLVNPREIEPMLKLALVCLDSGRHEKAIDLYQELLRRDPKNPNLLNNLATAYRKKRDYTASYRIIRELLNKDKTNIYAINNLGLSYYETGRYELAELTFQKGKKINNATAETYNNLGLTYLAMELPKNAITEFKKAAELNRSLIEPRLNLGDMYLKFGNYAHAVQAYQEVLNEDPLNIQANQNIAACYLALKKPENAKVAYGIIAEIEPTNKDALFNLGLLYMNDIQDTAQALRYFKRYVAAARGEIKATDPVFNYISQLEQMKKREEKARLDALTQQREKKPAASSAPQPAGGTKK